MKTISAMESLTGGLFASEIVKRPGASKYFKGSIVTYANEVKETFNIDTSNGVISKDVAQQMVKSGMETFKTDIVVSFTGNAGPTAMEDKPVGLVFIGINDKVYEMNFEGTRNEIRQQAVDFALKELGLD